MSNSKKRARFESTTETPKPSSDDARAAKKVAKGPNSLLDSILPTKSLTKKVTDEDFRIVVGCYERILYGIDAYWEKPEGESVTPKLRLEPIFIFPAHSGCIKTVAIGGPFLASGSTDEIIKLYDVKRRKELGFLLGQHQGSITCLRFYGKSHMLSASDDGALCIWRSKDWECLKTMKGHTARVNSVAVHPTGKIALSVSADKTVRLWNLMTGRKASVNKLTKEGELVVWNTAGDQYAIMFDRDVSIYNVEDAKIRKTIQLKSRFLSMQYYRRDADGREFLVTGSEDRVVRIWDTEKGECIASLKGHKNRIKSFDIIHSTPRHTTTPYTILISISSDGAIKVWDLDAAITAGGEDCDPLTEYNTGSRLTCVAVTLGFNLKGAAEEAEEEEEEDGDEGAEEEDK
ncbi:WD40-repeat-containing domain protein [Jimgerdemannia flammicorona]|uniref:WD40-repeat-containing domain protein n=1 Tax=Jimgerdemannia flammicorona TaxID=994334 RepID=A0A433DKQ3_9FUNG|nr:WD40-repeat-containing domain protein [Jimgerdemannia flammicorona]